MVRVIAAGIVSGASLTHFLKVLPPIVALIPYCLVTITCTGLLFFVRQSNKTSQLLKVVISLLAAIQCSMCWTIFQAQFRLDDALSVRHENVVTRLSYRVTSMVQEREQSQSFQAEVLDPKPAGIPRHIQVTWRDPGAVFSLGSKVNPKQEKSWQPGILPGQVWRGAIILRRPHGAFNPSGFDYEGLMFQRNVRAIGKLRGQPKLLDENSIYSFGIVVEGLRHRVRAAMQRALGQSRYGSVMIALAIGDQDGVSQEDWDVFNRTGITHLVSISGSHVTMIGALGGLAALFSFKRLRWRGRSCCEYIAARSVAAIVAMLVALLYCLLAGWGVPARRTFLMLTVTALAIFFRLPFSASRVLSTAAAVVTLMDPWSPVSTGFWLSFMAVAVLFSVASRESANISTSTYSHRILLVLKEASRLQWIITLAMLPVLAFLFQQLSLSSPLANAVAIPVMTFVVTPLALLTALFALVPGAMIVASCLAWLGHGALELMMFPIVWLSGVSWSMFEIPAFPSIFLLLAVAGIIWSLQPAGPATRWAGWLMILPALCWQPERPAIGGWKLWVFDVGQGAAVLLQTAKHNLLYDTGPRLGQTDAAVNVLLPAMRGLAVKELDWLVVSHPDLDHAGGLTSLLQKISIRKLVSSEGIEKYVQAAVSKRFTVNLPIPPHSLCTQSSFWEVDGVHFSLLNTPTSGASSSSNNRSCILQVTGRHHSLLLPGDIGVKPESVLIQHHKVASDVVLIPHHGSKTSSSQNFVSMTRASHAIVQAGFLNRFNHPDREVVERWVSSGAHVWRTDQDGALRVDSDRNGLFVTSWRSLRQRYWHHSP